MAQGILSKWKERKEVAEKIIFENADLVTEMDYEGRLRIGYLDFEKDDYEIPEKYYKPFVNVFNSFNNDLFIKEIIDTDALQEKFKGKKADTLAISDFRNELRKQISDYVVESDFTSMEAVIWNYVKERL